MREIQGHEVPEEQVEQWVAEAEAGYEVDALRQRGRPPRGSGASQVVPDCSTDATRPRASSDGATWG